MARASASPAKAPVGSPPVATGPTARNATVANADTAKALAIAAAVAAKVPFRGQTSQARQHNQPYILPSLREGCSFTHYHLSVPPPHRSQ